VIFIETFQKAMMIELDSVFYEKLFERMPGPMYVLNHVSQEFVRVNESFAKLFEGAPAEIEGRKLNKFIYDGEMDSLKGQVIEPKTEGERAFVRYNFEALTLKEHVLPIEVNVIALDAPYQNYNIGVVRDLTDVHQREEKLKDEIGSQREKTMQAFQANVRIWQITDMIRAAFNSMERLVDASDVDELLDDTLELMTSTKGLDFKDVVIYLSEGSVLKAVKVSEGFQVRSVNLSRDGRLTRIFNGESQGQDLKGEDTIVPLKGREGQNIGLLRVVEHTGKPAELMTEPLLKMRESVLHTLANTLALMIRNMRLYKTIEEQSIRDPLVDVFNRRYLDKKFLDEIDRVVRYKHPISVVMVDIDHFKKCNDTYGHLQGDEILKELGIIFNQRIRRSDTVCRYGGEEFVILLPETNLELGRRVSESILEKVRDHEFSNIDEGAPPLKVTISMGVTCFTAEDMLSHNDLQEDDLVSLVLKEADEALYNAKNLGRNRVVVYGKGAS